GAGSSTQSLRIWTLGQFRVECDGVAVSPGAWRRQAATVVLKLLLLADFRRLPREHIAAHIWPDLEPTPARDRLAGAIHALRHALEPGLASGAHSRYLVQEGANLVLRLGPDDWVDYLAFEELLASADQADDPLPHLDAAAALYGGDLFPEEDDVWCTAARQALRLRWHSTLLALAEARAAQRQVDAAAAVLSRLLADDPAHEEAARRLMSLLGRQGRRAEALRLYHGLERALEDELAVEPAPETQALATALQLGAPPRRRATRLSAAPTPDAAPPRRDAQPLVGRVAELAQLRSALLAAREGQGRVVLIRGAAGIGKTRLLEEIATIAEMSGFIVIVGRAAEGEQELPYAPIVEALRTYIRTRPPAALRRLLAGAEALVGLLPELAGGDLGLAAPAPLENEGAERLRLWMAVRTLLAAITAGRPLLLAIEDLHWIDEASLGLLSFLMRRSHDLRLLLAATTRDVAEGEDPVQSLVREGRRAGIMEIVEVAGLSPAEVGALAGHALGGQLTGAQITTLHAQCAGNPLFILELLTLVRGDAVADSAEHDLAAVLTGDTPLPLTIRQVLGQRLDHVSPVCRVLLQTGAVIGDRFDRDLLASMLEQDVAIFEAALDEALAAGLLRESASSEGVEYELAHALLRQALYMELPPTQRPRLHARIATALAERASDHRGTAAELIASHFARSHDHLAAAQWLERAGDHAAALHARTEALAHYSMARERLERRVGRGQNDASRRAARARLSGKLGNLCLLDGEYARAQEHFACARSLADDASQRAALWHKEGLTWEKRGEFSRALAAFDAAEREGGSQAELELSRGASYRSRGEHEAAAAAALRALGALQHQPEGLPMAHAAYLIGQLAAMRGDLAQAEERYRQSLAIRERLGDQQGVAATWYGLGLVAYDRGDAAQAEACLQRSLHMRERLGDQWGIAFTWNKLGLVVQYQGQYARAEECFRQAHAVKERIGSQPGIARSAYNLSQVARERGDYAEAALYCRRSLTIQEQIGDQWGIANSLLELGEVARERGDYTEAERYLRRSLATAERLADQLGIAACLHSLGMLACEQGDMRAALQLCRQSRRLARRIGARGREALAALGQAQAALHARHPRMAAVLIEYSRALAARYGSARTSVLLALATAELEIRRGAAAAAEAATREAVRLAVQGQFRREEATALRYLGTCASARGAHDEAREAFRAALALFEEMGIAPEITRTRQALAGMVCMDDAAEDRVV
ncbi:MAG TPA: tetratricopeptide repeat protein, partial [Chloroflexota bacterium]|nr:tetratricopeptide repeat protein [Chloroflexota bacterium]